MTKNYKGYTLVEILIVVTVLVILGLSVLISVNPAAQIFKGYDSRRKSDLQKIKTAMESYYADHDCYPALPLRDAQDRPSYVCGSDVLDPYLPSMPCDPNTDTPYTIYLSPPNTTCPQKYAVYAEIYSFFDKDGNSIPYCPKTIAISSPGLSFEELSVGCSNVEICANHYGCRNGACQWISGYEAPACTPNYCTSTCGQDSIESANAYCQNANNACQ